MQLESLSIGLRSSYLPASPDNPYEAVLKVKHNQNTMQIKLPPEVTEKLLRLCADEVAKAATVQIKEFVADALAHTTQPMLEGTTNA